MNCCNGRGQGRNVVQHANILIIVGLCRATRLCAAHTLLFMLINTYKKTLRAPSHPSRIRENQQKISLGINPQKCYNFFSTTTQVQVTLWHFGSFRPDLVVFKIRNPLYASPEMLALLKITKKENRRPHVVFWFGVQSRSLVYTMYQYSASLKVSKHEI
jgi:hypothetical protein